MFISGKVIVRASNMGNDVITVKWSNMIIIFSTFWLPVPFTCLRTGLILGLGRPKALGCFLLLDERAFPQGYDIAYFEHKFS